MRESTAGTKIEASEPNANSYFISDPKTPQMRLTKINYLICRSLLIVSEMRHTIEALKREKKTQILYERISQTYSGNIRLEVTCTLVRLRHVC